MSEIWYGRNDKEHVYPSRMLHSRLYYVARIYENYRKVSPITLTEDIYIRKGYTRNGDEVFCDLIELVEGQYSRTKQILFQSTVCFAFPDSDIKFYFRARNNSLQMVEWVRK